MATIYISRKKGAKPPILQEKTAVAGTSNINVLPDSGYDGLAKVIVQPTPSQSKSATPSTTAQTITPDSGKLLSSVEVAAIQTESKTETAGTAAKTVTPSSGKYLSSVTINPTPSQAKTSTPNTSTNKEITPDSGYLLEKVTIQPFSHSGTYTPAANTAQNDMGAYHDKRYVNTSGMIVPSGAKSITANGTGIDVSSYATANVNVPNPTLSGDATAADVKSGKTFYNSDYTKRTGTYVEPTINNITPSNSSPASMTANSNYKPSANGYAISSYSDISPLASSAINLTTGALYRPTINGYAIKEYSSCTPTADGSYHASGFVNMLRSGYSYSEKPTMQETTLWTNSSPTSDYAATTVTLSQSIENFDYIAFEYKAQKAQSSTMKAIYSVADVKKCTGTVKALRIAFGDNDTTASHSHSRIIGYNSDTSVSIGDCWRYGATTSSKTNSYSIPVSIKGLKLP